MSSMYEDVPGLYDVWNGYVLVRTRKNKNSITHKVEIRTEDLMQSILRTMPLRYQRYSMVTSGDNRRYIHTVNATRVARWCRTSGTGPEAPPAPGINLNFQVPDSRMPILALQ